jgi:hypothetical protein
MKEGRLINGGGGREGFGSGRRETLGRSDGFGVKC